MPRIVVGVGVLVAVVAALDIAGRASGQGLERIARCGSGHLFTSLTVVTAAVPNRVPRGRMGTVLSGG